MYLESDVIILTDVFENVRKICQKTYKLDPINYVTAPSISWAAMLKYNNVYLELIRHVQFFKMSGTRWVNSMYKNKITL